MKASVCASHCGYKLSRTVPAKNRDDEPAAIVFHAGSIKVPSWEARLGLTWDTCFGDHAFDRSDDNGHVDTPEGFMFFGLWQNSALSCRR